MITPENRAATYAAIFETDRRGAAILEDLIRMFSKPAVTDGGIDAVLKTYERMGQQAVIQHIVRQINRSHGVTDSPNDPEGDSP